MKQLFFAFIGLLFWSCNNGNHQNINGISVENSPENIKKLKDSIYILSEKLFKESNFDVKNNEFSEDFFDNNQIQDPIQFVTDKLLETNVTPASKHPLIMYDTRSGRKFQINTIKIFNHRWLICDFSDGLDWGELLISYTLNDDKTIDFKVFDQTLYVSERKP